ncbi:TPA: type II toxin-antitoxin system RelE/ParE family toxin [Serratia fonticola]|nr:type II toxin-antitoxin system RelE/ParE family toxin [Serratia fonticola]
MGIYLTPEFQEERRHAHINDKILCKAAKSIFAGLYGDPLGRYTFKKRLGLPGVGASDGARSIVFFNYGNNIYLFDMYLKSQLSKKKGKELEDDEIDVYCRIARDFIAMSDEKVRELIKLKELIEVTCDD